MDNTETLAPEQLAERDYILLIDKSGSMETIDRGSSQTRWQRAKEFAISLAMKCSQFDSNGIDVVVFSNKFTRYNNVTPDKVDQIFREQSPGGGTDTALALESVLAEYRKNPEKPITVLVVTDGEPNDQKAVERSIINHTKWMTDDSQTGISFIQIGDDGAARAWLQRLDDDLEGSGAAFDIVDTKNEEEMDNLSLSDIILAAVTD